MLILTDNPIPRTGTERSSQLRYLETLPIRRYMLPLHTGAQRDDWSSSQIFGHSLKGACLLVMTDRSGVHQHTSCPPCLRIWWRTRTQG
jgi:hypothetical protein